MGFQEIPHTADCAISVWAMDLPSLFIQAALGLNHISGVKFRKSGRMSRQLSLQAVEVEGLLVSFLSELIFYQESENFGFDRFELTVTPGAVEAILWGAPLMSRIRLVKAATFHNLVVRSESGLLRADIIFDV
jgi:SHS2 domain-containing protein